MGNAERGNRGSAGVYTCPITVRAVGLACAAIGRSAVGPAGALAVKGALSPRRQSQQDRRRWTCVVSTALGRCSFVVGPRRSGTAAARVKHRRCYRRRKGHAADFALQQWSSSCEYSLFPSTVATVRSLALTRLWRRCTTGFRLLIRSPRLGDLCARAFSDNPC